MTELGTEVHVSGHETRRLGTPPHGCARLMGTTAVAAAVTGATPPLPRPRPRGQRPRAPSPLRQLPGSPASWSASPQTSARSPSLVWEERGTVVSTISSHFRSGQNMSTPDRTRGPNGVGRNAG